MKKILFKQAFDAGCDFADDWEHLIDKKYSPSKPDFEEWYKKISAIDIDLDKFPWRESDELPNKADGEKICFNENDPKRKCFGAHYDHYSNKWTDCDGGKEDVTHWTDFPEPPVKPNNTEEYKVEESPYHQIITRLKKIGYKEINSDSIIGKAPHRSVKSIEHKMKSVKFDLETDEVEIITDKTTLLMQLTF